jgi:acyl carrier protein
MTIASRTPEGVPNLCPICGKVAFLEPCYPGGDSVCPNCGQLTWLVRNQLHDESGVALDEIKLESLLVDDLGLDSLEDVEAIMAIEEQTGTRIPDEIAATFRSVRDVIEYLRRCQDEA